MTNFEGMDVDQVSSIANQLSAQGDAIDHVITTISGLVNGLPGVWKGKDATEFEGWWNNQHRPALTQASQAVHGLATSARNNVAAQQNASNS